MSSDNSEQLAVDSRQAISGLKKQINDRHFLINQINQLPTPVLSWLYLICDELESALEKHPEYPEDPIHQVSIITEETGELTRAALQSVYEEGDPDSLRLESIQIGAMVLRFLINYTSEGHPPVPPSKGDSPQPENGGTDDTE